MVAERQAEPAEERERFDADLAETWRSPTTAIVLVTHSIAEAIYLSDRVIVLGRRPGRIKEIVPIELSRPRRAHRNSAALGRHVEHIWNLIRDEAARAIVEETA